MKVFSVTVNLGCAVMLLLPLIALSSGHDAAVRRVPRRGRSFGGHDTGRIFPRAKEHPQLEESISPYDYAPRVSTSVPRIATSTIQLSSVSTGMKQDQ